MTDETSGVRGAPSTKPRETESERAQGGAYPSETDTRRAPPAEGQPPRSKTEPAGSEGSSRPDPDRPSDGGAARETQTDPSTGAPLDD